MVMKFVVCRLAAAAFDLWRSRGSDDDVASTRKAGQLHFVPV
jgi:hypothetical protein